MPINNNSIFGAFTLGEVRSGRLTGDWLNKESVANSSWVGGGTVGLTPLISTVDRIDFSNDTANALSRGPLTAARQQLAAVGNSNYGWFGGGWHPATPQLNYSTVDRIDFSNDSPTASVRGSLSATRYSLAATGNSNYGWFGGGVLSPGTPSPSQSTVDRIDFSNDSSTASVRGSLSFVRGLSGSTGNSNYGWFGGGKVPTPAVYSSVDRIDFFNDLALTSPRGPLSAAKYGLAATGNSNYGWFGGGASPAVTLSTVERIDFSNDLSTGLVRGQLSGSKYAISAAGNSNYGWFNGGLPRVSTIDRIDFSNDLVTASPRGKLTAAKNNTAATSGVFNIRRQKSGSYGWFGGGYSQVSGFLSAVDRIDFSNDSARASPRGVFLNSRYQGVANGNISYGWFAGGLNAVPAVISTVDRIDFSNDLITASIKSQLSISRYGVAATGNSNYGWFGGGTTPAPGAFSTVDRIDFSNDSSTASVRGSLSLQKHSVSATGNSNYGWFGGGGAPSIPASVSTIDRVDFSNDSATASPRGQLFSARNITAATGNSNYGWWGSALPASSRVDRIDFSNDSATASVRGPLSLAKSYVTATGNSNYGWWGGGIAPSIPARISTVDRVNFSNDLATASPRGFLNYELEKSLATSNTTR